jgi:ketosteroid isomerase-like protein
MSQDNVELMREWNEAFNRRDLDAWLALMDPNIEITSSFMGGELHGHEGACEWLLEVEGTMPDFRVEIQEIQDLGDVLLVGVSMRGHGIGSDAPFEQSPWVATEWRDRKCVRSRGFSTKAEALEAVGLRE